MTLKQLRCLREIRRQSLNMSAASAALHTSQPGVSRQIQELEQELGFDLLLRRRNRVLAFTDAGLSVLESVERILGETDNIRLIAEEEKGTSGGRLTLATSHLHARYTLRKPVKAFTRLHPGIRLRLMQADADDVPQLVETNEADIGISTDVVAPHPGLVLLRGGSVRRCVIMPKGHPLASRKRLTLDDLARYPVVGYNSRSRGGQVIAQAFRDRGIDARFVVSASDSDVIRTYVEEGLGIAIVPAIALAGSRGRVHAVDATHLFPESEMIVSLRRNTFLRRYLFDFIQMLVPDMTWSRLQRAIGAAAGPAV